MTDCNTSPSDSDRGARFVELLGQHERNLNGYVLALVPNWADADDIVQQTRIRLWEQFDAYDATKDFGAWARTIAHFQILTHRKRVARVSNRLSDRVMDKLADTASTVVESTDLRHVYLEECLDETSEADRQLLARCYASGETIKQVASDSKLSSNSVRQRLFRLRKRLFECVERKLSREGAQ